MLASMAAVTAPLVTVTGVAAARMDAPAYHCELKPLAPQPLANLVV